MIEPLKRTGRTAKHKKRKIEKGKINGLINLITDLESQISWSARVDKGQTTATELIDWENKLHTTQEDDFKDTGLIPRKAF